MIELTAEQHQAISTGGAQPPRAHDPVTNEEYVLVRAEIYQRIEAIIGNDADWPNDVNAAAMQVFARDGWDDPRMDVYNALDPRNDS